MPRTDLTLTPLEDRLTPVMLPDGFAYSNFITGLSNPTALQELPDGRFLIAQQGGELRIASADGATVGTALTLTVDSAGERGLLGVAIDPNFAANGFVYLYHTVPDGGTAAHNRLSRFTLVGNSIDAGSEQILVDLEPLNPARTNHNGGALHFGSDGKLYVAVGENANAALSQSPTSRFGKILRYNPDGSIPPDNPTAIDGLAGTTQGEFRAIFAAGLRNPFTFDVDPATGRIFVNDVGANTFEEVNELAAGRNFGWPTTEGDFDATAFPDFTRPLVAYAHGAGNDKGFAVTGGAFYRPAVNQFPAEFVGDYFYADFINNWIRVYDTQSKTDSLFASDLDDGRPVDLDAARDGSLLVLSRETGSVARIQFPAAGTPRLAIGQGDAVRVIAAATGAELRRIEPRLDDIAFGSGLRVATGDFTGDGVPDTAVGTGLGSTNLVAIYDGATGSLVRKFSPFEASFGGGVYLAAGDVDGDGRADLAVSPDEGGGPRVTVYRSADPDSVLSDFFGIDDPAFRGGARVALGDATGDGIADLVVAAGFQGGPRIAGYEGGSVAAGAPARMFADFFAFEETLRNGAFVAIGDFDADGKGDIVAGAGPNGGPRVIVFSGAALIDSNETRFLSNFFAADPNDRGGVRVAVADLDGDARADLAVGTVQAFVPSRAIFYRGADLVQDPSPSAFRETTFPDLDFAGVFVG